jgi:Lipopolysaccharide biosynthesis proteins, LPS:glycosyltransferases
MDAVLCTDRNYLMPCGITILSLLENNKGEDITVHVVGMELNDKDKQDLKSVVDKYDASILFYNMSKDSLTAWGLPVEKRHLSISAYIRFFLFDILPSELGKVLYLDCDLIVTACLKDLWNTDIHNYSLAGVIDYPNFNPETYTRLNYSNRYSYINSGVLLINLNYWRQHDVLSGLLEYSKSNYKNIRHEDQDIINGVLHESILLLPLKYNVHNSFYWRKRNIGPYDDEAREVVKNPVIIHFTTSMKPWLKGSIHPMRKEYLKYKNLSLWKNVPVTWGKLTFGQKIRYYKRIILDGVGIKKHKYIKIKQNLT